MPPVREASWLETSPKENTTKQTAVGNRVGGGEDCLGFSG